MVRYICVALTLFVLLQWALLEPQFVEQPLLVPRFFMPIPNHPMNLVINTRSTFEIINLESLVYLKADGNYTYFYMADGKVRTMLSTLAVFADQIDKIYANAGMDSPFYRMGRSYFINIIHICCINSQTLTVSFFTPTVKPITGTKGIVKSLRDHLVAVMCPQ